MATTFYVAANLGLAEAGVWTLCVAFFATLNAVDVGLGHTMVRFVSVYHGRGDSRREQETLSLTLVAAAVLGLVAFLTLFLVAPTLAAAMEVPAAARGSTVQTFRLCAAALAVMLVGNAFGHFLRGRALFSHLTAAAWLGAAAYLACALVSPFGVARVSVFALALLGQSIVVAVVSGWLAFRSGARPRTPRRRSDVAAPLLGFAWRSQVAGASALIHLQGDAYVVAALFSSETLGLYGVASMAALAMRTLPLYAMFPIRVRLSSSFGRHGKRSAIADWHVLRRRWTKAVVLYGCASVPVAAGGAWLVTGDATAAGLTLALGAGYVVDLVCGVDVSLAAAFGQAGVAARSGLYSVAVNLGLTLPLAFAFGVVGVCVATAVGHIFAAIYLTRTVRRLVAAASESA